jgi:hypothetical protein
MSKNIHFKEKQTFGKVIPLTIVIILTLIWFFAMIWQIYLGRPFGPYPVNNLGLVGIGIILIIPFVLMLFLRMETQIRDDGVYYKLKPLEFSWHKIPASKIMSSKIIKNKSDGKTSLKIKLENNKSISLNTNKAEAMQTALNQII